jgi:hypothetical protein
MHVAVLVDRGMPVKLICLAYLGVQYARFQATSHGTHVRSSAIYPPRRSVPVP